VDTTTDAVDVTLATVSARRRGGMPRAAIQEANALAGLDTADVPAGVYL
jgi:hypothetical protein